MIDHEDAERNLVTGRPRWPFQVKLVISLLLVAFFIYLISQFSLVIPPFILAVILAFILSPVVQFLQNRLHIHRILAILLLYILLLGISTTIPFVLAPILASQFAGLNLDLKQVLEQARIFLGTELVIAGQRIDLTILTEQIATALQGLVEPFVGQTLRLVVEVISSIVWVIFIIVVSFYLLKDGKQLQNWFESNLPAQYRRDFIFLRDEINLIWSAFFRGQITLALVVACIFTVIGFIIGLPFALGMGLLAGLLEFLPSIGHGIWMALASILAFFVGSTWLPLPNWMFMLLVIGIHLFFQQFDLNYLIPRIIGKRVHLPPLVVILGIVAGAVLAGVMGIPLAAPTIASGRVLARYIFANLLDLDPIPATLTQPTHPPDLYWWKRSRKGRKT